MKTQILSLLVIGMGLGLAACKDSANNNDRNLSDQNTELSDQQQIEGLENESDEVELETEKVSFEIADAFVADTREQPDLDIADRPVRPEIVPEDDSDRDNRFKRLYKRLEYLSASLDKLFKRYLNLPERIQKKVRPWFVRFLKHLHNRLDDLKQRLIYIVTLMCCYDTVPDRVSDSQIAICLPYDDIRATDVKLTCSNHTHYVKKLVDLIEEIQAKIERFVDAI